ncbi:MAG: aspartate/glutamate racemase family protein [Firmicutes bacterium]|nr:aspartate/glutamate racemase family protein [Bacillota bacterium]
MVELDEEFLEEEEIELIVKGGRPFYGAEIGIIMMDTVFPRTIGDLGNFQTFSVPVVYKVLNGITANELNKNPEGFARKFIEAAKELENEGVKAITTCCGLAIKYQKEVKEALNIPFFASIYNLVPLIHSMIASNKVIGIFHDIDRGTDDTTFNLAGWSQNDIPIARTFMEPGAQYARMIKEDLPEVDFKILEEEVRQMTKKFVIGNPKLGAILLACTNYGQFSRLIQDISHVPVFGMVQYVEFVASVVSIK